MISDGPTIHTPLANIVINDINERLSIWMSESNLPERDAKIAIANGLFSQTVNSYVNGLGIQKDEFLRAAEWFYDLKQQEKRQ